MNEEEQEIAVIKTIDSGVITLARIEEEQCLHCRIKQVCGNEKQRIIKAPDPGGFTIGERVIIEVLPTQRVLFSFLIFIFPIFFMILFYGLASFLLQLKELFSIIFSIFGLGCAFILVNRCNNVLAKKFQISIKKINVDH